MACIWRWRLERAQNRRGLWGRGAGRDSAHGPAHRPACGRGRRAAAPLLAALLFWAGAPGLALAGALAQGPDVSSTALVALAPPALLREPGDDLGDHRAEKNLDMDGHDISNADLAKADRVEARRIQATEIDATSVDATSLDATRLEVNRADVNIVDAERIWVDILTVRAFSNLSDARLKTAITPLPEEAALALVRGLRPVQFTWAESGAQGSGFIAQEVQAIAPDLVRTSPENGLLAIDTQQIIPALVLTIRQLERRIAALEAAAAAR